LTVREGTVVTKNGTFDRGHRILRTGNHGSFQIKASISKPKFGAHMLLYNNDDVPVSSAHLAEPLVRILNIAKPSRLALHRKANAIAFALHDDRLPEKSA